MKSFDMLAFGVALALGVAVAQTPREIVKRSASTTGVVTQMSPVPPLRYMNWPQAESGVAKLSVAA